MGFLRLFQVCSIILRPIHTHTRNTHVHHTQTTHTHIQPHTHAAHTHSTHTQHTHTHTHTHTAHKHHLTHHTPAREGEELFPRLGASTDFRIHAVPGPDPGSYTQTTALCATDTQPSTPSTAVQRFVSDRAKAEALRCVGGGMGGRGWGGKGGRDA